MSATKPAVVGLADPDEREGGVCPDCGTRAEYRTCEVCGTSAWVIDCGHYPQPRPIAASQDGQRYLCEDCEDCEGVEE